MQIATLDLRSKCKNLKEISIVEKKELYLEGKEKEKEKGNEKGKGKGKEKDKKKGKEKGKENGRKRKLITVCGRRNMELQKKESIKKVYQHKGNESKFRKQKENKRDFKRIERKLKESFLNRMERIGMGFQEEKKQKVRKFMKE